MKFNRLLTGSMVKVILMCFTFIFIGSRSSVAQEDIDPLTAVALQNITDDNSDLTIPHPPTPREITNPVFPNTAQSGVLINIDDFRADGRFSGIDGSGTAVVILDSGIDLDDPFFGPDTDFDGVADRIVFHHDFADNDNDASDVGGHGSNVSSIVGSSDGTHTGMAPGVNIIHLKVFPSSGASGSFADIESALQWVVTNAVAFNIVSVNMSLGDSGNHTTPQQLGGIDDEMDALRNVLGVAVVSSSGNSFFDYFSAEGVGYPSADPNSMSIGAVYDSNVGERAYPDGPEAHTTGPDRITPFSQRHQTLTTLFAPGSIIIGAGAGNALTEMEGTSQASPHIAGIIALMQELAQQELGRRLTVDEVETLLVSTGQIINDGDDEDDDVANTGLDFRRVDVFAIGEAILDMVEVPDTDPPTVTNVDSSADTGDGSLDDGEVTNVDIDSLIVTFSEAMNDPGGNANVDDVTNPANYLLVNSGEDDAFETAVCPSPAGNDDNIPINSVSYDSGSFTATLALNGGSPLPSGNYRLFACGSTTLTDEADNALDGDGNGTGGDDFVLDFAVDQTGPMVGVVEFGGETAVDNSTVSTSFNNIVVQFDSAMYDPAGDVDSNDVTNPANYQLISDGANDGFDTAVCDPAAGDDGSISIDAINYNDATFAVTITVNGLNDLPDETYRFAVCGSGSLQDEAGNFLNDGAGEFDLTFTVDTAVPPVYNAFLPIVVNP